jgi:hypothetical protein
MIPTVRLSALQALHHFHSLSSTPAKSDKLPAKVLIYN